MTCHYLTLDVEYSSGASLNFSCLPVTSCGEDTPTFTSIIWMKSFSRANQYFRPLSSGIYEPPEFTNLRTDSGRNDILLSPGNVNGSSLADAVLDIGNPSMLSVGYYNIYGNPNMEILHSFTVFSEYSWNIIHVGLNHFILHVHVRTMYVGKFPGMTEYITLCIVYSVCNHM